jgi:dsRNA-specific ribonuclease
LTFYKYKLDSFQNLITKELYQQKYPNMNKEKFNDYKNSLLNDLQFIKDNNIDGIIINNELEKNEIVLSLNYLTKENDFNKILQFVKKNFQKRKISLKTKKEDEEILIDLIPILNYEQRRYFKYNNSNIEIKYKNHI